MRLRRMLPGGTSWLLGVGMLVGACTSVGDEPQFRSSELPTSDGGGLDGPATYETVQERIFSPRCAVSGCHLPPSPKQGLDLTAGAAFAATVGVPAAEDRNRSRIEAGSPERSYLFCKVDPSCATRVGAEMPLGGMLPSDELELLRAWIAAGAPGPGGGADGAVADAGADGGDASADGSVDGPVGDAFVVVE